MEEGVISVIVPLYNVEMYISACLDSILSQSYRNIEVIVVNDGSTDFSLQIAETYSEKDDRVKVYSFENAGLAEARNRGLAVATGEYLTFVDSDDMLLPDALETMVKNIREENADLIEGEIIRGTIHSETVKVKKYKKISYTPEKAIEDVLYQKRLLPSAWGKLYKKELFDNLSFEKGILYEDLNLFYKIFERCHKIVWIDFPVYFYRITEGSILNTWRKERLDVLKVTENLENYISEKYPSLLFSAQDRRLSANFNMLALCSIHKEKESADRCWEHIKKNRISSLKNPKVRMKNKAGVLLSYLGKPILKFALRRIYK